MMSERYNLRLSDCELIGYGVDTKVKLKYTLSDKLGEVKEVTGLDDVNTLLNYQDAKINKLIDENEQLKQKIKELEKEIERLREELRLALN